MPPRENHLIARLPGAVRKRFIDRCEPFDLVMSDELSQRDQLLSHAYFPRGGFISLVIDVDSHPPLEVGMVGFESMLGSELLLGLTTTPWRAVVQGSGPSLRLPAGDLQACSADMPALLELLQRTLLVRLHQQTLACACERFHMIGPRLSRWMLMSQDRAGTDSFDVTQAFMALMLGVRRVGVTMAAHELQQDGLIDYHRGHITVLDRGGLEARACSCYAADRRLYGELMQG
ncbi:MAG: Crp/Fnr family transcriptional regulator [Hydrogenophaga sp.]